MGYGGVLSSAGPARTERAAETRSGASLRTSPAALLPIWALLALLAVLVLRTAWLADDAYITFRSAENLLNGLGPRWNAAERVQAFTNPLWLLLTSAVSWFTGEVPLTCLVLSVAVSLAAAGLVALRGSGQLSGASLFLASLCLSKAFVEYSTSGLENPLSHLLLAAFALLLGRPWSTPRALLAPALCAGLVFVNRADHVLLMAPAVAWAWLRLPRGRVAGLGWIALGLLPAALWELFSLVYYGFLLPNTAYAKLGSDIPRSEYLAQGLRYLARTAALDPVAIAVIAAGAVVGLASRDGRRRALVAGSLAYVAYVVWVGGDFMVGRYITAPFFACACLLGTARIPRGARLVAGAVVLGAGLTSAGAPIRTGAAFGRHSILLDLCDESGIADERAVYFPSFGPLSLSGLVAVREPDRRLGPVRVEELGAVGASAFHLGPSVHVLDFMALGDPLLARIPRIVRDWGPIERATWRPGHLRRAIPEGYSETLASGENRIADADLARYYDKLCRVTRGPLFARGRWREILAFLRGENDGLLASYLSPRPE